MIIDKSADLSDLPSESIIALTEKSPLLRSSKRNIIVTNDPINFGISRMFSSYGDEAHGGIEVVKTMKEACKLFAIDEDDVYMRTGLIQ